MFTVLISLYQRKHLINFVQVNLYLLLLKKSLWPKAFHLLKQSLKFLIIFLDQLQLMEFTKQLLKPMIKDITIISLKILTLKVRKQMELKKKQKKLKKEKQPLNHQPNQRLPMNKIKKSDLMEEFNDLGRTPLLLIYSLLVCDKAQAKL